MSSPFRTAEALLVLALAAGLAGCDRETRDSRGTPLPETGPSADRLDPRPAAYEGNAFQIAQGQRYYAWMNCSGCHFHGGGGIGPPLMDSDWRYGGSMRQIVDTILEGRPNGMPSFKGRITEAQAWQLAAFVRSMSAQPRRDALPSRGDEMSNREPLSLSEQEPILKTTPESDQAKPR
ncbi:MAG: cytochrome c oxidase cbb3-type subunit [Sphingomonadales bacterium]|jgi:cytochrome c oxidase cbb3-type subunit 3|nr:cytochrome c oxidase cbb3-type subunit [Sphingomonadales bacterium]